MQTRATPNRPYHHGDLRQAVLEGALVAIAADRPAALSLRDVARRAGVSHAAPAHHFGDKAGVLTAIAAEGYVLLADAMMEAMRVGSGDLIEVGVAYIRFALERRAHFEVMFEPGLYRPDDDAVARARAAAAEVLIGAVRDILPEASDEELWGGALAAWSFAHGFATLTLNTNFSPERSEDVESAVRLAGAAVVELVAAGAFG